MLFFFHKKKEIQFFYGKIYIGGDKVIKEKTRWVPLKFDLMAKKIFGNNENQNQIKFLLKQILDIHPKEVTVLNTEIIDKPYKDKKFEVDLLVKTEEGTMIGVELNTNVSKEITNRNLFYMLWNRNVSI